MRASAIIPLLLALPLAACGARSMLDTGATAGHDAAAGHEAGADSGRS